MHSLLRSSPCSKTDGSVMQFSSFWRIPWWAMPSRFRRVIRKVLRGGRLQHLSRFFYYSRGKCWGPSTGRAGHLHAGGLTQCCFSCSWSASGTVGALRCIKAKWEKAITLQLGRFFDGETDEDLNVRGQHDEQQEAGHAPRLCSVVHLTGSQRAARISVKRLVRMHSNEIKDVNEAPLLLLITGMSMPFCSRTAYLDWCLH